MQGLILGGIAAAICWVAWRRHNRLLDDAVVAVESGEGMPIEITHFDHCGKRIHTTLTDIPPEIVNDFARQLLDVCAVRCSSPLPTNKQ